MHNINRKNSFKGFSLFELVIFITIISILSVALLSALRSVYPVSGSNITIHDMDKINKYIINHFKVWGFAVSKCIYDGGGTCDTLMLPSKIADYVDIDTFGSFPGYSMTCDGGPTSTDLVCNMANDFQGKVRYSIVAGALGFLNMKPPGFNFMPNWAIDITVTFDEFKNGNWVTILVKNNITYSGRYG